MVDVASQLRGDLLLSSPLRSASHTVLLGYYLSQSVAVDDFIDKGSFRCLRSIPVRQIISRINSVRTHTQLEVLSRLL